MLRIPRFLYNRLTDGGDIVSLTRRKPFTPPGRLLALISDLLVNVQLLTFWLTERLVN
jgi:hypothetical protein